MGVAGNIFGRFAVCKTSINEDNTFDVGEDNIAGSDINLGDEVRVRLIKLQGDKTRVGPADSTQYTTTMQQTGKLHIPNNVMRDMRLKTGEVIGFVAVSTSMIPSRSNGPIRERVSGDTPVEQRTRETNAGTFTGPVAVTGQVTVPKEVRDPMNIKQGDNVEVTIEGRETRTLSIGSGNRVTIPADVRDELGLDKGDEARLEVQVP